MVELGLAFDALVDLRHLDVIAALAGAWPELPIVINHFAKPWTHPRWLDDWRVRMDRLSGLGNCRVKVSGVPRPGDRRRPF